jgi:hypothetical protein
MWLHHFYMLSKPLMHDLPISPLHHPSRATARDRPYSDGGAACSPVASQELSLQPGVCHHGIHSLRGLQGFSGLLRM